MDRSVLSPDMRNISCIISRFEGKVIVMSLDGQYKFVYIYLVIRNSKGSFNFDMSLRAYFNSLKSKQHKNVIKRNTKLDNFIKDLLGDAKRHHNLKDSGIKIVKYNQINIFPLAI